MDEEWSALRFIGEEIEVHFAKSRFPLKKPAAPDSFTWNESSYEVVQIHAAWREYERKGRMARNMQAAHARVAAQRGSWGVGRFYFRIEVDGGQVFDIYYDRAPGDATDRLGHWFLFREMGKAESQE